MPCLPQLCNTAASTFSCATAVFTSAVQHCCSDLQLFNTAAPTSSCAIAVFTSAIQHSCSDLQLRICCVYLSCSTQLLRPPAAQQLCLPQMFNTAALLDLQLFNTAALTSSCAFAVFTSAVQHSCFDLQLRNSCVYLSCSTQLLRPSALQHSCSDLQLSNSCVYLSFATQLLRPPAAQQLCLPQLFNTAASISSCVKAVFISAVQHSCSDLQLRICCVYLSCATQVLRPPAAQKPCQSHKFYSYYAHGVKRFHRIQKCNVFFIFCLLSGMVRSV